MPVRVQTANEQDDAPLAIIGGHQTVKYEYRAIVKRSPLRDEAMDFVRFASSAENQERFARHIAYGPARRSAMTLLDAEAKSRLPTSAAHMRNGLVIDHERWADNQARMEARFRTFIERSKAAPPPRGSTTL